VTQEHLQEQELGAGELEAPLAAVGLVGQAVQGQVLEAHGGVAVAVVGSSQQGTHARHQLPEGEGLDQVVIGTGVQARHPVVDLIARGQHQHRRAIAPGAQAPTHLQTPQVGHRDIEDDCLDGRVGQHLKGLIAIPGQGHPVALERQRSRERLLHGGLIVDHEYASRIGHRSERARGRQWPIAPQEAKRGRRGGEVRVKSGVSPHGDADLLSNAAAPRPVAMMAAVRRLEARPVNDLHPRREQAENPLVVSAVSP